MRVDGRGSKLLSHSKHDITVGIWHCGDIGSAVGKVFRKAGLRVVTTCEGRSPFTEERARSSGIEILQGLVDVVAQSDIVLSIVLPTAALDVAQQYAGSAQKRPENTVFVEANPIGLKILTQIEHVMAAEDIQWVDAGIHGAAKHLEEVGVVCLSGPSAAYVESLCEGMLPAVRLGEAIGLANSIMLVARTNIPFCCLTANGPSRVGEPILTDCLAFDE